MGYRFLGDYEPQKGKKKNGAQTAPRSGNSVNPFAVNQKKPSAQATGAAQTAQNVRTSRGTALGGSAVTPVQMLKPTAPKLTKVSTPVQKTTQVQGQQLKLPNIQAFGAGDYSRAGKTLDRAAKAVKAGALNSAAGFTEIAAQFHPTTGEQSMGQFSGFGDLGRAVRENREKGTDINASIRQQEEQRRAQRKQSQQKMFAAADRLTEKGQQYEQEAKQGLGTVGQFLVDMGVTGTQMAGDAIANLVLPGSGLAMMGMRSYGQAAGKARKAGKSEQQQFLAGLKNAGIEVFTEKMFGAFSKVYGGAAADELIEKLVGKMTGNVTGQALLTWMINGVGEGVEEVTSDLLNPLADRLMGLDDGTGPIWSVDDLAQWGYDFLLGTAMGIVGGGTQLARGVQQGRAQTAESRYYDDLLRNGLGSAAAAENARRASAAMGRVMPARDGLRLPQLTTYEQKRMDTSSPTGGRHAPNIVFRDDVSISDPSVPQAQESVNRLKMPQLTDEQGRTYEQRQAAETFNSETKSDAVGVLSLLRSNIKTLHEMQPVTRVIGSEVEQSGKATDRVYNFFRSIGGKVRREGFGEVLFSKSRVRNSVVGHGTGEAKIQLAAAVPSVIEHGAEINYTPNWKGRGYDSYVFAAPVDYNGVETYVVAIVTRDNANRYYLHEALDGEGNLIYKKPEGSNVASDSPTAEPQNTIADIEPSIDTTIPQGQEGVNTQGMQNGGEYAANRLRMPQLVDEQGRTYEERVAWQQIPETQRAAFDDAQRIAQRFGARVVVSQQEGVNGSYHDGVISLNPYAVNPVRQTLIHELTHHMERSGLYGEFRDMALRYVAENMGADVDSVRQAVIADYARNGVALDEDGATREIVAKFAEEKLFTDETTVRRLLAEDRNLFQRIYDWIRDMAGRLTGTSEESFLRSAEKLYAKAMRETTAETGRGTQMLFAGENARTANMQTLNRAQALEASGAAAEDIRRETGWFRGMDGKWRFEIDDSSMEYRAGGDARLLEESGYRRLDELTEKWVRNAEGRGEPLTAEELAESERLESEYFDRVWTDEKYELADFLRHSSLFEAYPQLRHASLVFEKTEPGVNGYYNARTDTIVLSDKLRGAPESTLVHEIQHLIQRTEGFARGSTPEYWAARDYETGEIIQALEQEYNQVLRSLDSKTLNKYLRYQEVNRAMENLESAEEGTPAAEKYVQLDRISDQLYTELWDIPEFKRLLDLKRQIDTPREVYDRFYRNTAGEIEARDAANRRSYNAEQRRLRMPNLGNANTVFAGGNGTAYDINPFRRKAAQLSAIQQSNPFDPSLGAHTWIRSEGDILTYQEAIDNFGGVDDVTPDFRAQDVQAALDSGYVTVYSSYPIEQGTFVTPSRMEAQSYAGEGRVYSKQVPLSDVAWLDEVQGQYTGPVGQAQYSTGRGLDDVTEEQAGENNNSPAQDAVYGRQRAGGTDIPLGISATQESNSIVSRTGENSNPLSEILRGTKRGRVDAGEAMQKIGGEELARALDTGEYAADADGMLYRVKPEEHIDQRASYQVGSRKMNAFQFDHPELHPYYAEAAGELLYELDNAQPGGDVIELPGNEPPFEPRYIRTSRVATDRIAYLLDDQRLSYADIEKALHAIVEDKGQENFAAAKRVELVLDNMLTNGYRAIYGEKIAPNAEYIRLKQDIPGAEGRQTLQAPRLTTYEQREAERQGNETPNRVDRLVSQIDDLTAAAERAPSPAAEAAPENAAHSDYLDALARDENMFTSDAYTLADRLYDLQLRRAQQQEAPPERPAEQVAREDLDEIAEMFTDQGNFFASREDRIRETENMVTDHTIEVGKSRKEKATEAWSYFYRKMVDAGHSVDKFAKAAGDPYLYQIYNQARASSSAGVSMITDAQTNVNAQKVGESLNGVFSPIRAKGEDYYRAFQLYMFDLHNIDRMSLSQNKEAAVLEATAALNEFDANHPEMRTSTEAQLARMTESLDPDVAELARERMQLLRNINKADAIKDKPVFSFDVTADISQERARRAAQEHPEFEQYRQQVRTYIDNLMQYRVDSGLMTQADADYLKRLYPNYVPTMRKGGEQAGKGRDRNAVRIGRTVGRAEGGTADLVPLHEALGRQTMKVVREGSKNRFGQRLLDDFVRVGENSPAARYVQEAHEYEHEFTPDTLDDMSREQLTKDKTLTVFKDGKLWELTVDDTMFDALKALSPDAAESNAVTRTIRTANNLFKALVTGYNPTFTIRNTVRDLQTAGLYTRDAVAFARNYPKALAEIKNNGEYWQMYKALGGSFSSVFDYNTGTVKEPKGRTAKLMAKIEALNMAMEQAPRLAEFMGVVEKGGTSTENLADALYAAADVTVNFGRSGTLGKVLNANYVPFLNPGIQGFDKLIRRVTETKGGREWAKLAIRAVALGVAPTLLNSLLYHDDDEWDDLRDSDKDTNYLFKLGNGTWLKIPKGRELSLLGITADRIGDVLRGDNVDLIATINTMGNQVAPANPLTSNIASALFEAQLFDPSSPGRTWYGGDIENQRLQSYAPGQRYDSSTDIFSKAVGGALGISPKKLNYVLDQYSGVVGDFLLPLLTPQAERGMFSKAFTVDAVTSNRLSGDFYDESDALTYAKNGGDETAAVVSRFWSKQQSACSDLYKQIREVEASNLSDREKRQKTRELKALVNGIQKNAMAVEDTYRAAVEKNLQKGMDTDDVYRAANKDCFGAEYALQVYSKDVYEKAKNAKSNGVSYDDYYTYYFGTKGLKATDDTSVTTQKFAFLQSSGMDLTSQAEIYFADMASDKVLQTQAELEISSGITAEQFYQYKVASSGMTKKAEKMQAINSLNLTSAQKDAIYYAEGWARSTIGQAPWRGGYSSGYTSSDTGGNPFTRARTGSNPFLRTFSGTANTGGGYERALAVLRRRRGLTSYTETGSTIPTASSGYERALAVLRKRRMEVSG